MIDSYNNYYNHDIYNNIYNDNNKNQIKIDNSFPKKQLVEIMKPYLLLYFTHKYSLINTKKNNSRILLYNKLKQFYLFNPLFGRKQIKVQPYFSKKNIKKYKQICSYHDKHVDFYRENDNFLTSHLSDK